MVDVEKRQFLKALGILLAGYFVYKFLSNIPSESSAFARSVPVSGDGSAKVEVKDGALVVK